MHITGDPQGSTFVPQLDYLLDKAYSYFVSQRHRKHYKLNRTTALCHVGKLLLLRTTRKLIPLHDSEEPSRYRFLYLLGFHTINNFRFFYKAWTKFWVHQFYTDTPKSSALQDFAFYTDSTTNS